MGPPKVIDLMAHHEWTSLQLTYISLSFVIPVVEHWLERVIKKSSQHQYVICKINTF